ncbi:MAG: ABC transporter permease [Nitriliruptoraceae bacterium]|nr:ABC transporter permease [Nitriliruptoraceae bacterium]
MRSRAVLIRLIASLGAIAFAVGLSAIVLLLVDVSPLEAFGAMLSYGARLDSAISIVNRAVPLYLSALAVAIGFQMGLFNIGVEGQYRIAALIAGYVGAAITLPAVLHVAVIVLVAMVVGALWASIAAVLKATRGIHEVISTIMLNFIATGLGAWLLANYLREEVEGSLQVRTAQIPESGRMPSLNPVLEAVGITIPAGSDLQSFVLIAIAAGVGYYVLIWRTRLGYDLRAFGANPSAAEASGVDRKRMIFTALGLSGAFAGLVVMGPVLGFTYRYTDDLPTELGFTGIAVALVGRNKPVGMAFAALLFAFLNRSAQILDLRGIPKEIEVIIGGVIILAVVIAYELARRSIAAAQVRASSAEERAQSDAEVSA